MYLLLFDIDGTLLSMKKGVTGKLISQIINELYHHDLPPGLYPRFAGRTDLFIIEKIAEMLGADIRKIRQDIVKIFDKSVEVFKPYMTPEFVELLPGVPELLETLSQYDEIKLGLITGNHERNAYLKLGTYGLEKYFDLGAFGNDHKERSELPLIAINRANKKARKQVYGRYNTIIIGDTQRDIQCAKDNQLPIAAVATGLFTYSQLSSYNPDLLFNDFSDTTLVTHRILDFYGIR